MEKLRILNSFYSSYVFTPNCRNKNYRNKTNETGISILEILIGLSIGSLFF